MYIRDNSEVPAFALSELINGLTKERDYLSLERSLFDDDSVDGRCANILQIASGIRELQLRNELVLRERHGCASTGFHQVGRIRRRFDLRRNSA